MSLDTVHKPMSCCGITEIKNFFSRVNSQWDNSKYPPKLLAPARNKSKEEKANELTDALDSARDLNTNCVLATLADHQKDVWEGLLKDAGFVELSTFFNYNSGNMNTIYQKLFFQEEAEYDDYVAEQEEKEEW